MELNEETKEGMPEEISEEIPEDIPEEDENIFEKMESIRKPWDLISKILVGESVAIIILLIFIESIYYWRDSPARIAKEYVQQTEQGEWNQVYDSIWFNEEDNVFLSKKMFVTAQTVDYDSSSISRVKINSVKEKRQKNRNLRKIDVSYTRNEQKQVKTVPMIKKGTRWYVNGNKIFIKKNMKIEVPKDAKVSFDRIVLDESLKKGTEGNRDFYEIPEIFDGLHYLVLEKEGMEKYENLIRYKEEEAAQAFMKYTPEVLELAANQAQTDMVRAYQDMADSDSGSRRFSELILTENRIKVKHSDENQEWIEVNVSSRYTYHFKERKKTFQGRDTEMGRCNSVFVYSYDSGTLKLEKKSLNTLFL